MMHIYLQIYNKAVGQEIIKFILKIFFSELKHDKRESIDFDYSTTHYILYLFSIVFITMGASYIYIVSNLVFDIRSTATSS